MPREVASFGGFTFCGFVFAAWRTFAEGLRVVFELVEGAGWLAGGSGCGLAVGLLAGEAASAGFTGIAAGFTGIASAGFAVRLLRCEASAGLVAGTGARGALGTGWAVGGEFAAGGVEFAEGRAAGASGALAAPVFAVTGKAGLAAEAGWACAAFAVGVGLAGGKA